MDFSIEGFAPPVVPAAAPPGTWFWLGALPALRVDVPGRMSAVEQLLIFGPGPNFTLRSATSVTDTVWPDLKASLTAAPPEDDSYPVTDGAKDGYLLVDYKNGEAWARITSHDGQPAPVYINLGTASAQDPRPHTTIFSRWVATVHGRQHFRVQMGEDSALLI